MPEPLIRALAAPGAVPIVGVALLAVPWTAAWAVRHVRTGHLAAWAASLPALIVLVFASWGYAAHDHQAAHTVVTVAERLVPSHVARSAGQAVDAVWLGIGAAGVLLVLGAARILAGGVVRADFARPLGILPVGPLMGVLAVGTLVLAVADRPIGAWALVALAVAVPAVHQASWIGEAERRWGVGFAAAGLGALGLALGLERWASRLHGLVWADAKAAQVVIGATPAWDPWVWVLLPVGFAGVVVLAAPGDARSAAGLGLAAALAVVAPCLGLAPAVLDHGPPSTLARLRTLPLPVHAGRPEIPGRLARDDVREWSGSWSGTGDRVAAPADLPLAALPPGALRLITVIAPAADWPVSLDPWRYTWVEAVEGPADTTVDPDGHVPPIPAFPRVDLALGEGATVGAWVEACLALQRAHPRASCVR